MPSPFPGMNPYLEQPAVWEDFHNRLATYISEDLSPLVRPNFFVKLEEKVFIHEPSYDERRKALGKPDVSIVEPTHGSSGVAVAEPRVSATSPLVAKISDTEIERHSQIEIRDRHNRQLVTLIELLSPSNKRYGPDREQYLMKRSVLLCSPVSIVEIDLLRGGPRFPINDVPPCDYLMTVSRPSIRPNVEVWPVQLRERLPIISIPLKGEFPDVPLDLQQLLHRVYDIAGYEDYIYESQPEPALNAQDEAWARAIISPAPTPVS